MRIIRKYKFSDKNQSLGGTISTIMGIASLAFISYGITISFRANGHAGIQLGSIALLSIMLSAFGCIIGLISFKEEDKFYLMSKIGSLLCGMITIFMLAVFLMGI